MTSEITDDKSKDFEWAFGLNRLTLRLMGLWPDDEQSDGEPFNVIVRAPFMIIIILLWLFLPQMYALFINVKDLTLVVDNLITSTSAFTSCVKLYFIWINKEVLKPVVASVARDWQRPKRKFELEAMTRESGRAKLFTLSGYLILGGCYLSFSFAPLAGVNIRMISNLTDYGDRFLMVQSYFPFDYSPTPIFEAVFICQMMAGSFIGMSVSIPDNYFAALVFHTSAQFEILGVDAENIIPRDGGNFRRRLKAIVLRHVHLIKIVRAIETSFTFVVAAQLLCMTVMVVCLNFQILRMIGTSEDKPSALQIFTLISTLGTVAMHTLVDCYAGEILTSRSNEIFSSVYNSRWFTMQVSGRNTRDLLPVMAVSKKPRPLTMGKIFSLSLTSYCQILKSIAGYISMLVAVSR